MQILVVENTLSTLQIAGESLYLIFSFDGKKQGTKIYLLTA